MKTCATCRKELPEEAFYGIASSRLSSSCKLCVRAYSKEWAQKHRESKNAINRRWIARHADRRKRMNDATNALWTAIRAGKIVRGTVCSRCGSTHAIEAAHADYTKPLEVVWMCTSCHRMWDANDPKSTKNFVSGE